MSLESQINETQTKLQELKIRKENPEEILDQTTDSTLEDLRSKNIYLNDEVINSKSDKKSRRDVLPFR